MDTDTSSSPSENETLPSRADEVDAGDTQDWNRFNRIMQPHLRHDIIGNAADETRMVLAAQRELLAWNRETRSLTKPDKRAYKSDRWSKARSAWQRRRHEIGTTGAVDALLAKNYKLILAMAYKHRTWGARRGYDVSDLFSIASMGFVRAIEKFDPSKKVRLSTYSAWWMKALLGRELHENASILNVPYNLTVASTNVSTAIADFYSKYGRGPTDIEIAKTLRQTWNAKVEREMKGKVESDENSETRLMSEDEAIKRVHDFRRLPKPVVSIDTPLTEDGGTLLDVLAIDVDQSRDPLSRLEARETAQLVMSALNELSELERWVVRNRYIVEHENDEDGTLKSLGESIPPRLVAKGHQITRERVRQIEVEALAKLRTRLAPQLEHA